MKRLLIALLALTLLAACAPSLDNPISNDDPLSPKTNDTLPRPGDDALVRGAVFVASVDLLTMESYPLQFMLVIAGNLPTPCDQLRVNVNPPDKGNKIIVEVYSLSAPDAICIEVLQPFSQNIPLGSFPSGHYTIWINGEKAAEFDA